PRLRESRRSARDAPSIAARTRAMPADLDEETFRHFQVTQNAATIFDHVRDLELPFARARLESVDHVGLRDEEAEVKSFRIGLGGGLLALDDERESFAVGHDRERARSAIRLETQPDHVFAEP